MADETRRTQNRTNLFAVALVVAISAFYLVLGYLNSRLGIIATACPLKAITDIPCPSCGGTRAILALLSGDLRGAFILNPLVVILCFVLPVGAGVYRGLLRGGRERVKRSRLLWGALIAAIIANWIYLIMAGR